MPVLNIQNQAEWIEKAKTLPTRKLEKAIAKVAPGEAFPKRVRYVTETRVNLSLSLNEKTLEAIKRVQDLESQKRNRAVTLEETLAAMSDFYLEKNDPVEKAKRALGNGKAMTAGKALNPSDKIAIAKDKVVIPNGNCASANTKANRTDVTWQVHSRQRRDNTSNGNMAAKINTFLATRRPIVSSTAHKVVLRDDAQCTATKPDGTRCGSKRWLHIHHIQPVSLGGGNTAENLTTLCSAHHQMRHFLQP